MDVVSFIMGQKMSGGGGTVTVEKLNVAKNGPYTAPEGTAYNPVNVNVPNSYASSDEGKVVYNGGLVSQTSVSISSNGHYDTTRIGSVNINVPLDVMIAQKQVIAGNVVYSFDRQIDEYNSFCYFSNYELTQYSLQCSLNLADPFIASGSDVSHADNGTFEGNGFVFAPNYISTDIYPSVMYAARFA